MTVELSSPIDVYGLPDGYIGVNRAGDRKEKSTYGKGGAYYISAQSLFDAADFLIQDNGGNPIKVKTKAELIVQAVEQGCVVMLGDTGNTLQKGRVRELDCPTDALNCEYKLPRKGTRLWHKIKSIEAARLVA